MLCQLHFIDTHSLRTILLPRTKSHNPVNCLALALGLMPGIPPSPPGVWRSNDVARYRVYSDNTVVCCIPTAILGHSQYMEVGITLPSPDKSSKLLSNRLLRQGNSDDIPDEIRDAQLIKPLFYPTFRHTHLYWNDYNKWSPNHCAHCIFFSFFSMFLWWVYPEFYTSCVDNVFPVLMKISLVTFIEKHYTTWVIIVLQNCCTYTCCTYI